MDNCTDAVDQLLMMIMVQLLKKKRIPFENTHVVFLFLPGVFLPFFFGMCIDEALSLSEVNVMSKWTFFDLVTLIMC